MPITRNQAKSKSRSLTPMDIEKNYDPVYGLNKKNSKESPLLQIPGVMPGPFAFVRKAKKITRRGRGKKRTNKKTRKNKRRVKLVIKNLGKKRKTKKTRKNRKMKGGGPELQPITTAYRLVQSSANDFGNTLFGRDTGDVHSSGANHNEIIDV